MAASKQQHPGATKQQSLGTRIGKFLNKVEKLERQRDERLANAPKEIAQWFAERKAKLLEETSDDVLDNQGIKRG